MHYTEYKEEADATAVIVVAVAVVIAVAASSLPALNGPNTVFIVVATPGNQCLGLLWCSAQLVQGVLDLALLRL